ncbi:Spy/CpxP family protein refolding chaperone [Elusimicrobiota bacterium]
MKRIIVLLTAVLVLSGTGVLFAEEGMRGNGKGSHGKHKDKGDSSMHDEKGKWMRIMEELDLSQEQKEQIRKKKHESMKKKIEMHSELKLKLHDLKYELTEDKINTGKMNRLIDEISDIQKEMLKFRVNSLLEFKEVLTEEQWNKIKDVKSGGFLGLDRMSK